jgi:iron complex outermembrane receptor protein
MFKLSLLASGAWWAASSMMPAYGMAAQSAAKPIFTIPAQDLESALTKLAQISGRNILFTPDVVRGEISGPVDKAPNFEVALREMLTGTHMVETISGDSVLIQRRAERDSAHTGMAAPATENFSAADREGLAEVIVSARKRSERLQDVPISLTAIGGAAFNDAQHHDILSLNELAPSVNFVISTPHTASFAVRGIGSSPANDGLESSTAVFFDGVYLGRPGMAVFDLIDIDNIQVLRGPQGTLFGKNTTAGAVVITTAPPSFTFHAALQATGGNYDYQQYQGFVTGPLTDNLAGRFTFYRTSRDGWIHQLSIGGLTDSIDRYGFRGQLLFRPNDAFDLRLIAGFDKEDDSNTVDVLTGPGATPAALQKKLGLVNGLLAFSPDGESTEQNLPSTNVVQQISVSAEANWRLDDGLTLTSISAYRKWNWDASSDIDLSSASILRGGYVLRDQQVSQELRVATPSGKTVEGVAGGYFFYHRPDVDQITYYGADAPVYLSGTTPAFAALVPYANTRWDVFANPTTYSYALFGQLNWHVTDPWVVTAGLRGTEESKSETVSRPIPVTTATGQPVPALASVVYPPAEVGTHDFSPSALLSTSYRLAPEINAYALASRGAKAGGVNSVLPAAGFGVDSLKVKPETATSFELGLKTEFLERRLRINGDIFYTRFEDYQAAYLSPTPGRTSAFSTILTNAGTAKTRGFEVEVTAIPLAGLRLNMFGDLNDATYASYRNAPCPNEAVGHATCNLAGRPVAGAPKWSAGVNGEYSRDLTADFTGFIGAEYKWKSAYYSYLDDSSFSVIPAHGLVNARCGLRTSDGRWTVTLWAKNLSDGRYPANISNSGSILPGTYATFFADPRTFGLTVRADF